MEIRINNVVLSQYHAGQTVELSARTVCDHRGQWYSVVTRDDRSTSDPPTHTVRRHKTEAEADAAIRDAGLMVSCDHWRIVTLPGVAKLTAMLKPIHEHAEAMSRRLLEIRVDPVTLIATYYVGGMEGSVPVERLDDAVRRDAKVAFADLTVRVPSRTAAYEMVRSDSRTEQFQADLRAL